MRFLFLLIWFSIILTSKPAFASSIQEQASLIDPVNFARTQTGVASIVTLEIDDSHYEMVRGTGSLIDIQSDNLQGRVLLTCAHVVRNVGVGYARFMDYDNNVEKILIKEVFCHPEGAKYAHDIAFVVLDKSVDTSIFKPLSLNYSESIECLLGKEANVYGCSGIFGKLTSAIFLQERTNQLLRRGMKTRISGYEEKDAERFGSIFANVHPYQGLIAIARNSEPLSQSEKLEIVRKIPENSGLCEMDLFIKALEYGGSKRPSFSRKIICKDNFASEISDLNEDVEDLDKEKIIENWNTYVEDQPYEEKRFQLGNYFITFFPPLSQASGRAFHGDSGGAWVINDADIVGITVTGCKSAYNKNMSILSINASGEISEKKEFSESGEMMDAFLRQGKSDTEELWLKKMLEESSVSVDDDYFDIAEKHLLHSNQNLSLSVSPRTHAVTLFNNKDWIMETLEIILKKYDSQ